MEQLAILRNGEARACRYRYRPGMKKPKETQDPPSQTEDGAPNVVGLARARATRQKDIEGVLP
jgi:hypothetical protein